MRKPLAEPLSQLRGLKSSYPLIEHAKFQRPTIGVKHAGTIPRELLDVCRGTRYCVTPGVYGAQGELTVRSKGRGPDREPRKTLPVPRGPRFWMPDEASSVSVGVGLAYLVACTCRAARWITLEAGGESTKTELQGAERLPSIPRATF